MNSLLVRIYEYLYANVAFLFSKTLGKQNNVKNSKNVIRIDKMLSYRRETALQGAL